MKNMRILRNVVAAPLTPCAGGLGDCRPGNPGSRRNHGKAGVIYEI